MLLKNLIILNVEDSRPFPGSASLSKRSAVLRGKGAKPEGLPKNTQSHSQAQHGPRAPE